MSASVCKAAGGDLPEVAETLSMAFFDDPVFSWWVPDDGRRKEILPAFFGLVAEANLPGEEIYRDADGVAAAVWVPPGLEGSEEDAAQFAAALSELSGEYAEVAFEILGAMETVHPAATHLYLPFIGIRPAFQGLGLGSALLRVVLDRCDAERIPAYLEATCENNKRLYERHDFVVSGPGITVRDSPPLTPMWREPR